MNTKSFLSGTRKVYKSFIKAFEIAQIFPLRPSCREDTFHLLYTRQTLKELVETILIHAFIRNGMRWCIIPGKLFPLLSKLVLVKLGRVEGWGCRRDTTLLIWLVFFFKFSLTFYAKQQLNPNPRCNVDKSLMCVCVWYRQTEKQGHFFFTCDFRLSKKSKKLMVRPESPRSLKNFLLRFLRRFLDQI